MLAFTPKVYYSSSKSEQSYSSHGENTTNTEPPVFIKGTSELTETSSLERQLRTQKHEFQQMYEAVRDLPVHLCITEITVHFLHYMQTQKTVSYFGMEKNSRKKSYKAAHKQL